MICKDKKKLNVLETKNKLKNALELNFYYIGHEWPYKEVMSHIIAEQYMEDYTDGEPKAIYIASDREQAATKFDYYDLNFNHLDILREYPNASKPLRKPKTFEQMIMFSEKLSNGFPHVRVDFHEVDGQLYFGEMAIYHFSGFMPFQPAKWDGIFWKWLSLP